MAPGLMPPKSPGREKTYRLGWRSLARHSHKSPALGPFRSWQRPCGLSEASTMEATENEKAHHSTLDSFG
jgi:hypothetical protein